MKKFIIIASLAIIATLSFYACQKDSVLPTAVGQLNQEMLDGEPITVYAPNTDGSSSDRGFCNLYMKVAFRTSANYATSSLVYCSREMRVIQENIATGVLTQIYPGPAVSPPSAFHSNTNTTGTNFSLVVPDTGGNRYYVEFKKVQDITAPVVTPYIHVFMSNDSRVQTDPLTYANVSWNTTGPINHASAPYTISSKGNVSATCVVTP